MDVSSSVTRTVPSSPVRRRKAPMAVTVPTAETAVEARATRANHDRAAPKAAAAVSVAVMIFRHNRLKMRKSVVFGVISLLSGMAACVPGHNDYSGFQHIPADGWAYAAPVEFVVSPADSVADGVMSVAVRHSNAYPYSNLWLELSTYRGDSIMSRDTVNVRLADIYGRWFGHGLGTSYQITDTLPGRVELCRGTRVVLRHLMRVDTLSGIEQVGVSFDAM